MPETYSEVRQTVRRFRAGEYDFEGLLAELKKVKTGHPDKDDIQVASEDSVTFDSLARTMDMALASGFPDLSLLDSGSAGL